VVVAGSTWPDDEILVLGAFAALRRLRGSGVRMIVVPHEPVPERLAALEKEATRRGLTCARFTENAVGSDVMLVDARGFLAEIYAVGAVAYVGGGFGKQIHSIIEPVAHGRPVAFGPAFRRSPEAGTLLSLGAAITMPHAGRSSAERLGNWWHAQMSQGGDARRSQEAIEVFLGVHRGAGRRVAEFLAECWRSSAILKGTGGSEP
jgi:3-deoxy-D-manno-octulosonic-acid transferase